MQDEFCCVNIISRSCSTWKTNQITLTYLKIHCLLKINQILTLSTSWAFESGGFNLVVDKVTLDSIGLRRYVAMLRALLTDFHEQFEPQDQIGNRLIWSTNCRSRFTIVISGFRIRVKMQKVNNEGHNEGWEGINTHECNS
jgi:hypothetical protein